jgi:zinc transport system ATP-binding protein
MTQKALLSLHNVSFQIGAQKILDQVSFNLLPGNFLTIIGPNGAGKTTLLKLIIGLLNPTSGDIYRSGHIQIGYVPQKLMIDYMLPLTVAIFLKRPQFAHLPLEIIKPLGIENLLTSSMHNLSGGELQRVLLARALLNQPNLLILDEPSQGVDVKGQKELFSLIAELREKMKFSVMMVSHDLYVVHKASDQVLCLNHHICCMGKPDVIRQTREYKALFPDQITEPLSSYTHQHDHSHDHLVPPKERVHD